MTALPCIALDQLAAIQHVANFNYIARALSSAALFAIKQRESRGLTLVLYGGNLSATIRLPDQRLALTPSATNYVQADVAGAVSVSTIAPTGWPGPMPTGAYALYQLSVGADSITSGVRYFPGRGTQGPTGPQGAVGDASGEIYQIRKFRSTTTESNFASTDPTGYGFAATGGVGSTRTCDSTSFTSSIVKLALLATTGNSRSNVHSTNNIMHRGSVAGRGGFRASFRWGYETSTSSNTTMRSFVGLYDAGATGLGVADPSTFVNIIGVGGDAGDSNLSLMHNDGSGTATKTALVSDDSPTVPFPMRNSGNTYELTLSCESNAATVEYKLVNAGTGASVSGSISSDLPASTQFLGVVIYVGVGAVSGIAAFLYMQIAGYTRY